MFMEWKSQQSNDDNSPRIDLQLECNCYQNPSNIFVGIDKLILKCIWRATDPGIAKTILKNKNKVESITLSCIKSYHTATVIKRV